MAASIRNIPCGPKSRNPNLIDPLLQNLFSIFAEVELQPFSDKFVLQNQ